MDTRQRYIFIDTETTGLDPYLNEMVEIAIIVVEEDKNYEPKEIATFHAEFPAQGHQIDLEALKVNGKKVADVCAPLDELNRDVTSATALQLAQFLTDYVTKDSFVIGINIKFDLDFLVAFLNKYNISIKRLEMYRNSIDIQHIARILHDKGSIECPNFRGITLAKMLLNYKFKNDEWPHSALPDTRLARDLYFKLREMI